MDNLNTELMKTLLENGSVEEFFRQTLEDALNNLLQAELSAFPGYNKYDPSGRGTGDNRNGFYERTFDTKYGVLHLHIPRDREGQFDQQLIPPYTRRSDGLEDMIIHLYRKGITTREISDLIEKMYGHHYSPTTVSNITRIVEEQVQAFHSRVVRERYAVIFCDAAFLNVRRNSVDKEALHVFLGITSEGEKELLEYALYPSESSANYEEILSGLKGRGLSEVLLFVSDGLSGLPEALKRQFPKAEHQSCWVHLSRRVEHLVRRKDRKQILTELKAVYTRDTAEDAEKELDTFIERNRKNYPRIGGIFANRSSLFSFYRYPKEIRQSIYTTNLIERMNKELKRRVNIKEQFPNEGSLERFVCSFYCEYNRRSSSRIHRGFGLVQSIILELFESRYHPGDNTASEDAA